MSRAGDEVELVPEVTVAAIGRKVAAPNAKMIKA
jgi:hypothetical protein